MTDNIDFQRQIKKYVAESEFDNYKDFEQEAINQFGDSNALRRNATIVWNESIREEEFIDEEEDFDEEAEIEEEKLPNTLEKIKQIMKEKLTKREQTKQVIETTSKSFTIKEFVELTGMNYNTARRELGQGVKNDQFERVSRGVYRRL